MWAILHRTASSRVVYANPPDVELSVWQEYLHEGDLFVDVGANVGVYSLIAAEVGAHVIAIEPDPDTALLLRENVQLNGYDVDIRECALGSEPGTASFTVGLDAMNQLSPTGRQLVNVKTLDEIIGDMVVHGLKIDVEGHELGVLQGGRRALADGRIRQIQLEWNEMSVGAIGQSREPIATLLKSYGYELYRVDHAGVLAPLTSYEAGPDVIATLQSVSLTERPFG